MNTGDIIYIGTYGALTYAGLYYLVTPDAMLAAGLSTAVFALGKNIPSYRSVDGRIIAAPLATMGALYYGGVPPMGCMIGGAISAVATMGSLAAVLVIAGGV